MDLRTRNVSRDDKGHYIMTKRSTIQKDTTILNVYISQNRALKYTKQTNRNKRRDREISGNT